MKQKRYTDEMPSIYLTAISGAEKILKTIENSPLSGRLLLKNDDFLESEKYQKVLVDRMEFFVPKEEAAEDIQKLGNLFRLQTDISAGAVKEEGEGSGKEHEKEALQIMLQEDLSFVPSGKNDISLKICRKPYQIPFTLSVIPYGIPVGYPQKKNKAGSADGEVFTYHKFPTEEFLAFGFLKILEGLELLQDLSWYREIYQVLVRESVEGRKVWESMSRLVSRHPISSLEKRLDTIRSYETYGYMKKRWKSQSRREKEHYPQWEQVIQLLDAFFTPIVEEIQRDEVFLGDWMPQLGRYLD